MFVCILDINPFSDIIFKNFSHSVSCLFILLVVSLLAPFQISFSNNFSHSVSCLFILLIVSSRHFPKKDKYMANSRVKRCSTSAIIRKIQSHKKYHLTPIRAAIIKREQITNVDKNVVKRKPLCTVGGIVSWCSHYGKKYGGSSENLKITTHIIQKFHSRSI